MTDELEDRLSRHASDPGDHDGSVTLAYLDLDRFKIVNDSYGHRVGDLLLLATAKRLNGVLREDELLARHGGDELTVFSGAHTDEPPAQLGLRLLHVFDEPFVLDGLVLDADVSIGIATSEVRMQANELIRCADAALYEAKDSGAR